MPVRLILTGLPGSGKSTLCQTVIQHARAFKFDIKGVLSPPIFESGEKTAIDLIDLSTGERVRLANLRRGGTKDTEITTQRWAFDPTVMEKGEVILASSTPCELLVIDELGPLEFERKMGWQTGLAAADSGDFRSALLVIRPRLLEYALQRWPDAQSLEIESPDQVPDLTRQAIKLLGLPA